MTDKEMYKKRISFLLNSEVMSLHSDADDDYENITSVSYKVPLLQTICVTCEVISQQTRWHGAR
jgi:hypothetical protein